MLTIDDLRNPKRKSGFDHVNGASPGGSPTTTLWRAASGAKKVPGDTWRGSCRKNPEQAAQDYCDYVNGLEQPPVAPALNTPGHARRPKEVVKDHEVEAALGVLRDHKAQKAGRQGYVYCIGAKADPGLVKIGYSVNPEARVGELQTGNGRHLFLLAKFEGTLADERALHAKYLKDNTVGEWFHSSPALLAEFGLNYKTFVGERGPDRVFTYDEYLAGQAHSRSLSDF